MKPILSCCASWPMAKGIHCQRAQTFEAVPLGDSRVLGFLDEVYTVGFPKAGGSTVTITRGLVSGKEELEDWIKTDAQVTHGNSGGAAVDKSGRLVGVPTKVRPDIQPVDTDNDGFPDGNVNFGSVGLIRPVELVAKMLTTLREGNLMRPEARWRTNDLK